MKRLLAMILACVLMISEFPVYADEADNIGTMLEENTVAEATDVVIDATDYGADPTGMKDSAEAIWAAFEAAKEASENGTKSVTVYFPKGEYHVYKDRAQQREYHTSNTSSTDAQFHMKHIGILIEDQKNLTIEGDGSLFMIHGDMMALAVVRSENVTLHNFAWDYAVPTVTEMTVIDMGTAEDGRAYADYYIPQCFPYEIKNDTILWKSDVSPYTGQVYWTRTGEHENSYSVVTHQPDTEMSRAYYSGQSPFQNKSGIEKLEDNKVRIYYSSRPGMLKNGMVFQFCSSAQRPTAGAFTWESKNVTAEEVDVHYMDGFGWLIQMSENVYYRNCNLMPRDNSGHFTVSYADGIHASGAKGEIVIDNCNFSYTHDDPINLHGTFTRVEERIDANTLRLKYIHAQQGGFPQFHVGDKVQFFTRDTLESTVDSEGNEEQFTVSEVISNPGEAGNDLKTMVIKFEEALPEELSDRVSGEPKYVAENVTYAPEVTITNCTFKNIVTRGILCTTRNKVLIENNIFYPTSMATIFLSNDSNDWYESGPIRDMTIRGNVFYVDDIGRTSWANAPAIYVHPVTKNGGLPDASNPIHKNILIEENTFYMDEDAVVYAESVENLQFKNNKILRMNPDISLTLNPEETALTTGEEMSLNFQKRGNTNDDDDDSNSGKDNIFRFVKSKDVVISGNTYDDGMKNYVVADTATQSTLTVGGEDVEDDEILSIIDHENGAVSPAVGKVTFVNSNPDVLYVAEDGKVTGLSAGEATVYAYYEWNGTKIKSNEVTINVSGDALPVVDGKVTITTTNTITAMNENFSIEREDATHYEMTRDSYTIDMHSDGLWTYQNGLKNLLLYEPDAENKNDFRAIVKVDDMPVNEANQWDNTSFILYKDDDNYITIGKKSHIAGFCYVVEKAGDCTETGGDSADNNVTSGYLGITYKDGTVTLSAKAAEDEWKDVVTITEHTVGADYKIGLGAWESNDRSKKVTFSDFKVGTSQDSFETLEASESVAFINVSVDEEIIEIEKNPTIDDTGFKSNHAKIENISIAELEFNKTAAADAILDNYYHVIAESGKSEITLSVTKDSESKNVVVLHGDYRTELSLNTEGNTYTTAPIALRDGINTFYVRVYAEDGITYKQHILCITYTPDYVEDVLSDRFIKEIIVEGKDVTKECMVIGESSKITLDKAAVHVKVTAQEGSKVTFGLEGSSLPEAVSSEMEADVTLNNGEQRIKVVIIASNGEQKTYYLNVEKSTLKEFDPAILAKNAKANSQQLPANGGDGGPAWAFDDEDRWWHSRWGSFDQKEAHEVGTQFGDGKPSADNPIWIQTGFDKKWYVSEIEYTGRPSRDGLIHNYEVSVANLDDPLGTPTEFEVVKSGTLDPVSTTQTIKLDNIVQATHIRITVTDAYDVNDGGTGDGHVGAKNISIFGCDALESVDAKLEGYSLSLEGTIGVNFHMQLGKNVTDDAGAYMNFTLNGEEYSEIYVNQTTYDEESGYHVFKCPVPVKDMDTEITGQIILSDGSVGELYTYKVKEYADYILNSSYNKKTKDLVKAMSDFGDYASEYFAEGNIDEIPEEMLAVTSDTLKDYQATLPENKDSIYYGSSLLLKSNTVLRHYFTEEVEIEGYEVVQKGNLYYIETEGIPAHELGEYITTTVETTGGNNMTITYSPLSYAYIALSRDGVSENLTTLMRAMYLYHQAAEEYLK
ncbi:MAG: right-handed parallel beta-helix repeat-containing protein [Roseburia sp.]|nr:right-handed parallel beta-helix repeat-containing protein [Roseburia sp.]